MEEEISKTEKSSALLPALGLLGLGVGTVALVLGIFAMKKAGDVSSSMTDKIEKAAALSLEIKKLSDRTDSLAIQIEDFKSADGGKVENLAQQTKSAIERIGVLISENRTAIQTNRKAIEELSKRPVAKARTTVSPQATVANADSAESKATAADSDGQTVHVIKSGDTFAKIALKYKKSINAIQKANPDLKPSRLMIGQKVVIPQ